jgi:hypothetical protein
MTFNTGDSNTTCIEHEKIGEKTQYFDLMDASAKRCISVVESENEVSRTKLSRLCRLCENLEKSCCDTNIK